MDALALCNLVVPPPKTRVVRVRRGKIGMTLGGDVPTPHAGTLDGLAPRDGERGRTIARDEPTAIVCVRYGFGATVSYGQNQRQLASVF